MILTNQPGNQAHGFNLRPAKEKNGKTLSKDRINHKNQLMASEVQQYYVERGVTPYILYVLQGAVIFAGDFIRQFHKEFIYELAGVRAKSYEQNEKKGPVEIAVGQIDPELVRGQSLLVMDDIIETGETLLRFKELLLEMGASEVKTLVLLDKPSKRQFLIEPDWKGFEIQEDQWVFGYGMDYNGKLRHYPNVVTLVPRNDS
ncbi:phosphoribosyltransferase [Blastopirellula marina]|nr:phosphoribosyltransferase family protein [Blastopirellula marina]